MTDYRDVIIKELLAALKECSNVMCCETKAEIRACDNAETLIMKYSAQEGE